MSNTSIVPTIGSATLSGVAGSMGLAIAPLNAPTLYLVGNTTNMSPVTASILIYEAGAVAEVTWSPITNGAIGTMSRARIYSEISIQVSGVFGSGGSVKIEGSNDGTNWATVSSAALTSAGFFAALTCLPKHLRPNCTAGDGTTALTVIARMT